MNFSKELNKTWKFDVSISYSLLFLINDLNSSKDLINPFPHFFNNIIINPIEERHKNI